MAVSNRGLVFVLLLALAVPPGCSAPIKQTRTKTVVARKPLRATTPPARAGAPKPLVPKSKDSLGSAQRLELVREYRQGIESFEAGRLEESVGYFEAVERWRPHYQEVDSYLRRAYIAIGMKTYTNGDLEGAIRIWKEALRFDPKDSQALAYIRKTERELRQIGKIRDRSEP